MVETSSPAELNRRLLQARLVFGLCSPSSLRVAPERRSPDRQDNKQVLALMDRTPPATASENGKLA
jgi:hypothetical protein